MNLTHKDSQEKRNYYDILDIKPEASQVEVESAYSKAKEAYSYSTCASYSLFSQEEYETIHSSIEEAYTVLSSPDKRRLYNDAHGMQDIEFDQYDPNFSKKSISKKGHVSFNLKDIKRRYELNYEVDPQFENTIDSEAEFNGSLLKEIREYKNVSLERMADMTKILKNYLIHIEEDNYEKLPATVYTRGFIFQYAKTLKLNPDLVSNSYTQKVKLFRGEIMTQ